MKRGILLVIEIDFNSPDAIYIQLRNQIVIAIAQDQLHEGESLPSVRQLADHLGVNMHTVNKAYSILKQEGYLTLDRRKGAVISIDIATKNVEVEAIHSGIKMIVAQAICKDITKDEMHRIVSEMYDVFHNLEDLD